MIGCLWESVQECVQELWVFSANGYLMTAIHSAGQAMNVKAVICPLDILAQLERFKKLPLMSSPITASSVQRL